MPVHVEKRRGKWRIVEAGGRIARTENGRPRDGGGHDTKAQALAQARAINASLDMSEPRAPPFIAFREPGFAVDFGMRPEVAYVWFRSKGLRPSWRFDDMIGQEHDAAFTIAKMLDRDLLADVKAEVDRAIDAGSTIKEFSDTLRPKLQARGWWGTDADGNRLGSAWRLETIFRTNVQQAYAVGHWEKIEQQASEAPWLLYDAIDDHRTRPWHAALDGTVRRYDDPFWQINYPPNGYNCRCSAIQLSDADIAAAGIEHQAPPRIPRRKVRDPRTGKVRKVPATTDPGFDRNPGRDRLKSLQRIARTKDAEIEDMLRSSAASSSRSARPAPDPNAIPEFRPASTVAEARRHTDAVIRSGGKAYTTSDRGAPLVRFRHGRTVGRDVPVKKYGKASFAKLHLETANVIAEQMTELAKESDRLGLPRLRGFHTAADRAAGRMGDGVMAISAAHFNGLFESIKAGRDTILRQWKRQLDGYENTISSISNPNSSIKANVIKRRDRLKQKIDDLESGRVSVAEALYPRSQWKPGDPPSQRPHTVSGYFPEPRDRIRDTMWHEFGHHIHQQGRVTTPFEYERPPLEARLRELYARRTPGRSPSAYSETNSKEWFAENYAAYKMGREDLVDPLVLKFINEELEP